MQRVTYDGRTRSHARSDHPRSPSPLEPHQRPYGGTQSNQSAYCPACPPSALPTPRHGATPNRAQLHTTRSSSRAPRCSPQSRDTSPLPNHKTDITHRGRTTTCKNDGAPPQRSPSLSRGPSAPLSSSIDDSMDGQDVLVSDCTDEDVFEDALSSPVETPSPGAECCMDNRSNIPFPPSAVDVPMPRASSCGQ
ncbi:hypothetical protein L226DRAFT_368214 [Lentinus tigrinus ALCF2SS1-7]|uniref:Uncharacterized protein n=1 Tax=Lentinus tigrinus ALCF2SS1-6 TaxID=1328759 RepID=A0A5C2RRU5_9APHY|nr:hypothetical protein L227DRAFT_427157 [Lentinus tigrinus ALCF2SS1-6]RPD68116.1 hypothetical protein L226DRAFT_368214 [Lentinus tigrinus ALCF2SS1-7]